MARTLQTQLGLCWQRLRQKTGFLRTTYTWILIHPIFTNQMDSLIA
jgi:hypothetical protein